MNRNHQNTIYRLIEELRRVDIRLVLLIGAAGTGKTTLMEKLAASLSAERTVGIVDADIGQSHLGPPATVAWGRAAGGFPGWASIPVESFYFTGAISPAGNLLQLVTGARLMTDQALAACDKVLVDTTGLVTGPAAMVLKHIKIDMLRPDAVIALERKDELSHILNPIRVLGHPRVVSLPVSPEARDISPIQRADHRRKKFRAYFAGARVAELPLKGIALRFTRGEIAQGKSFGGRLVSLRDRNNIDLALGIMEEVDGGAGKLLIRTPLAEAGRAAMVLVSELEAAF